MLLTHIVVQVQAECIVAPPQPSPVVRDWVVDLAPLSIELHDARSAILPSVEG